MTGSEELSDRDMRALVALADGSLSGARAARLEQRAASSPQLAAELAVQRRAVAATRALDDEPPARLREHVAREQERVGGRSGARTAGAARGGRARAHVRVGGGALVAVAAAALLALIVLPGGAGNPTVLQAATFAERPATGGAPGQVPGQPALLDRRAEGLAFPDWTAKFDWRATGTRSDTLDGRRATTVFYENRKGARIGYTIVSGSSIAAPEGAEPAVREGVRLRSVRRGGRVVVTWLRNGHTCVLSGAGVARDVLLELAGWRAKGAIDV